MNSKPIKKLYYSISEVSELTSLKQYVLRYWETEFLELKPSKNRAGNRIYKDKDIRLVNQIKDLLYNRKFTIDGARMFLQQTGNAGKKVGLESSDNRNKLDLLNSIQAELEEIIDVLKDKSE